MAKHAAQRVLRPSERSRRRSRYVASLDGLRALSVLAVIAYHMKLDWAPGGLMGVTVFFVISGYLITGLLVAEYDATGSISLPQFWLRRVRRIVPAVLLALAGTLVLCAVLNPTLFAKARADLLPSLLFYNNWWQIFRDMSYFEAAGAPSPLTHYWSLAIEEQFYIVWPVFLLVLFKLRVPKPVIAAIVGALACASAAEMALLYDPIADPSRIYYGTDTRAASLLIGALLAFVWPSTIFGHRRTHPKSPVGDIAFNVLGVAALAGIVAIVVLTNSYTAFPYRGGIVGVSLLAAALIAVLVVPYTWVAQLLELKPFVWVGKRSYGMYLWHYPIVLATANMASTVQIPWWVRLAQLVVIFAVSDLSYRFVESPIRSGALRAWWNARKGAAGGTGRRGRRATSTATVGICALLGCAAAACLVIMPPVSSSVPAPAASGASQAVEPGSASAESRPSSGSAQAPFAVSSSSGSGAEPSEGPAASSNASTAPASSGVSPASSVSSSASPGASSQGASTSSASASSGSPATSSSAASSSAGAVSSSSGPASSAQAAKSPSSDASKSSSRASSGASGAPANASPASPVVAVVAAAVHEQVDGLTDEQREQAALAQLGLLQRIALRISDQVDESVRKAEEQRKQDAYDELFMTEHLNDAGGIVYNPVLVGDSVAAGCENEFYKAFPYGHSDALVNRNIWESPYGYYDDNGQAGSYAVFCLGTNNAVTDEQIDELLDSATDGKKVILVNIRCPRDWEAQTNKAIADAPKRHSNIVAVVDWYGASAGHDEYFYEDGIHLNEVGAKAYIGLIREAIESTIE